MFDFNQIKYHVTQSTLNGLQGLDPFKLLENAGIPTKNISDILNGDFSSIVEPEPFIVDYNTFYKNYGFEINFTKIKNNEEIDIPDTFFEKLFLVAQDGIFQIENEDCLLMSFNNDIFIITKDTKIIHYASHARENLN